MADDPNQPRLTLSKQEVADAMGFPLENFCFLVKRWRPLGFPRPLRFTRRYDPLAIKLWQDRMLRDAAPGLFPALSSEVGAVDAEEDELTAARREMNLRAGKRAA